MIDTVHRMMHRDVTMVPFHWVPWGCRFNRRLVAWLTLPIGTLVVSIGCGMEPEEREVASFGPLLLTRLETPEEREEREEAEEEDAFMEREANRYCEWSY